ncbi:unnamed protein product, partial [Rotaria sp. Silwood2]
MRPRPLTETIINKNWFLAAHLLAELFTYRLHRVPISIRAQLLGSMNFEGSLAIANSSDSATIGDLNKNINQLINY